MEKQETRLIGVAHCIVPKEELIVEPVHTTTPLSVEMLADDGQLNKSSAEIEAPASSTEANVPSTTTPAPTTMPTQSATPTTSTASTTQASAPPMTVAEVIFRRNDTELAKPETIEINGLLLTSNATETNDNATISIGNDVDAAGIGNDTMQSPDTSDTPEASETFEAFETFDASEAFELMPDNEEVIEPSEVYVMATTTVPEMTSASATSTLENSTVLPVPVSSTTSTPPTVQSTTVTEILLDKIEEASEAPEQDNYVYEVMTLPQVVSPTDDRAQNIVLDKEPSENLPNDTAVAA